MNLNIELIVRLLEHDLIYGIFIFIFLQIFLSIFFLPCSPLPFISGLVWGFYLGILISILSCLISCSITYMLGKFILKEKVMLISKKYNLYSLTNTSIFNNNKSTFGFIGFIQLNPLLPASSMGYLIGFLKIPFYKYIFYTFIYMIPMQLLSVNIGNILMNLYLSLMDNNYYIFILFILFFILILLLFFILQRFIKKIY
jgi:uncharacterized membrane protein YdjX (TVP38/TMEM64 family)